MTVYLTLDDALHTVERLGFRVRDRGLLASALARPAAGLGGEDVYPDLDRKAAALLESVVRNHALVDGNKRTGWVLTQLFYWINGYRHTFTTDAAFDLVISVAEGRASLEEVVDAFAAHRSPRN